MGLIPALMQFDESAQKKVISWTLSARHALFGGASGQVTAAV
jgi:hypothetical protein